MKMSIDIIYTSKMRSEDGYEVYVECGKRNSKFIKSICISYEYYSEQDDIIKYEKSVNKIYPIAITVCAILGLNKIGNKIFDSLLLKAKTDFFNISKSQGSD